MQERNGLTSEVQGSHERHEENAAGNGKTLKSADPAITAAGTAAGQLRRKLRMKTGQVINRAGTRIEGYMGSYEQIRNPAPVLPGFEAFSGAEGEKRPLLSAEQKRAYNAMPRYIPLAQTWYRYPIPGGMSGDGSEFHLYLKKGSVNRLVIFLSGGGMAWNGYTAAHPVTGAAVAGREPNYYWSNLRPFTQLMNINIGITEVGNAANPFDGWNFAVIPYSTGDFHVGDGAFLYAGEGKLSPAEDMLPRAGEGNSSYIGDKREEKVLYFHGRRNMELSLREVKRFFPAPEKILLAGDSAGAFAVPTVAADVADILYSDCRDITLFSDSAELLCRDWTAIVRDVWQAPERFWKNLRTGNLACDWYRDLLGTHQGRFYCLYASSTHDYLLSTFYNDLNHKKYEDDAAAREMYHRQLLPMLKELREAEPGFAFFINNWRNPLFTMGMPGTVHTAVRQPFYYQEHPLAPKGTTMAKWLGDAVDGKMYDVGMELVR